MTVENSLTAERLRELLHYDPAIGVFKRILELSRRRRDKVGSLTWNKYLLICVDGKQYRAHRLAWLYMTGSWPTSDIDHKNRIKTDNRWTNLRQATRKQNMENTGLQKNNKSGICGVYWDTNRERWHAMIQHNKRMIHIGRFVAFEDAVKARKDAENLYFTHHLKEPTTQNQI
jgi:hypothetical protein